MAKEGPIMLVEDDEDDTMFLRDILHQLKVGNPMVCFNNAINALEYLHTTTDQPFFILCDVNLPLQNGLDFKRSIDGNTALRKKSIPFIFYSTAVEQRFIDTAFSDLNVQGFFQKGNDYKDIMQAVKTIIDYWKLSNHPDL